MVAPVKRVRSQKSVPDWHAQFVVMLPAITTHAKIAFRHLDAENRAEMVQEVVCNACCAFARLVELGKADLAYAGVLARYGVAQAKDGRKVGGRLNCKDVLSPYCQRRKKIAVERLDKYDKEEQAWQEVLVEDHRAGPADTAAARIDISDWMRSLPRRNRRVAELLATGETTSTTARRFRLSAGRISQLRSELHDSWRRFQGE
jgi:hypothetical protein